MLEQYVNVSNLSKHQGRGFPNQEGRGYF